LPSIVSHTVVGLAGGSIFPVNNLPQRFWVWLPSISLVILVKLFRSKKKPTSYEYTEYTEKNTATIKTKTSVPLCFVAELLRRVALVLRSGGHSAE